MEEKTMILEERFEKVDGQEVWYHYLYKEGNTEEWREKRVCDWIGLKGIRQDEKTNEVQLDIEYLYGGRLKTYTFSRAKLTVKDIIELKSIGVDVTEKNRLLIVKYLEEEERQLPVENRYRTLGWDATRTAYYASERISLQDPDELSIAIYDGDYDVAPKGSSQMWEQLIKKEVIPHTPLLFALTLGFAAPLVSYLKEELDLAVIFYHFVGGSTTGKTTATQLMVSPFGKPVTQEGGLLLKWNGTQNGIIGSIADHHGVPFGLDESSLSSGQDYTKFIYMIAEGIEKARMTQELENRERRTWSGVICSTGEHSLLRKSNQNDGLLSRVFEMGQVNWTTSAEQASELKRTLTNHYGHHGEQFVRYIMQQSEESIIAAYDDQRKKLLEQMEEKDQYTERIIDRLAVITLTANYMKQCFGWDFDVQQITDFIVEQDQKEAGQRNVGQKAYNDIIQRVLQEHQHFSYNKQKVYKDFKGRIEETETGVEVVILPTVLKSYLKEAGYEDAEIILSQWRDKGYLSADSNKFTRKRKAEDDKDSRIPFNILLINDSMIVDALKQQYANDFDPTAVPSSPMPRRKIKNSQLSNKDNPLANLFDEEPIDYHKLIDELD